MNQEEVIKVELPRFVEEMKSKLEFSKSKYGDFTQYRSQDFLYHFADEVKELSVALAKGLGNSEKIRKEAVDVANMAFMLWWAHSEESTSGCINKMG